MRRQRCSGDLFQFLKRNSVFPFAFALEEAAIGFGEQFSFVFGVARETGEAKGSGEVGVDVFFLEEAGGVDGGLHALDFVEGLFFRLAGKDDNELIAAIANEAIVGVEHLVNGLGNFSESFCAEQGTMGVHEPFEIVYVEKDEAGFGYLSRMRVNQAIEITM